MGVAPPAVWVGTRFAGGAVVGESFLDRFMAPLRVTAPDAERSRRDWLKLALAYAAAFSLAASRALLALWAGGAGPGFWAGGSVSAGVLAIQLSWMLGDAELRLGDRVQRATRSAYAGTVPRVGLLLSLTILCGILVSLTFNYWSDTARAGRVVRETGRLPISHLNVTVSAARVIPKEADPLEICNGSRKAVLVGRHENVAFVLLLPGGLGDPGPEVVPLTDDDYAVATAAGEPRACDPKLP